MTIRPRAKAKDGKRRSTPYQWVIEGDIKSCFEQIDHHRLMQRVRRRVADRKVNRLLVRFLKAGVLEDMNLVRSTAGTPQGGVISPLLANIALSAIEERYARWVNDRTRAHERGGEDGLKAASYTRRLDRAAGRPVLFPVRYCDDFVILVRGSRELALSEKEKLTEYLREELRLELSPEKTRITALTDGFEFLGHRVRLRWHPEFGYTPRIEIPKTRIMEVRRRVKRLTKGNRTLLSLSRQLQVLNPILRGWAYFYRYCTNAKVIFGTLDWYVDDRLWRWMRKKHRKAGARWLMSQRKPASQGRRRVWREGPHEHFITGRIPVMRFRRGWMRKPDYAMALGELSA